MKKAPPRVVPSWDDYYMALAYLMASRSKDPSTQHGAVIVDIHDRPRGFGYNGPPKQINDKDISWRRPEKYPFIIHAEKNAIQNSYGDLNSCVIYVTGMPCVDCMKDIISKGLRKIIYGCQESVCVSDDVKKSVEDLSKLSHVVLEEYTGNLNWMRDRIRFLEELGIFS